MNSHCRGQSRCNEFVRIPSHEIHFCQRNFKFIQICESSKHVRLRMAYAVSIFMVPNLIAKHFNLMFITVLVQAFQKRASIYVHFSR